MITSISVGVSVLIASWLATRAAKMWGFEDLVFALSMFGFVFIGIIVIIYPFLGYSIQSTFYAVLLVGTILFGCMSVWMGQD